MPFSLLRRPLPSFLLASLPISVLATSVAPLLRLSIPAAVCAGEATALP